jgi:pimeloyl-ACP methyl ester carboxylesterase
MTDERIPLLAGDGRMLRLVRVHGPKPPHEGPVLLVHGAGVRSNLFRPPTRETLVSRLLREGYDVWLLDWRASIDLEPCQWDLDQAALFDYPAAVDAIVAQTGASRVKAIVHCQGSTSFTMSALAGLLPAVSHIVSSASSLFLRVPLGSRLKSTVALPLLGSITDVLDPSWGIRPPEELSLRLMVEAALLAHNECDNDVCRLVSFTYGSGFPALWRHENLSAATHEWLKHEFAAVPLSFFRQMARCVDAGHLVRNGDDPRLPVDFSEVDPPQGVHWTFLTGERNQCFLPESQVESFRWFNRRQPGQHRVHILPDYGHLCPFFGEEADTEATPLMLDGLRR